MNKIFFIISIIIYILSGYISDVFDLDTNNTLWSGISFIILLIPLSIGCIVNSKIYKDKNSAWRFIFYYLSFMFSFGILLIAIITSFILKNVKECIIILIIYTVLSLVSILGDFICKKIKSKNKGYFIYFSVLFILSCVIHTILILTIVI